MALDSKDLQSLRLLIREEISAGVPPLIREEINAVVPPLIRNEINAVVPSLIRKEITSDGYRALMREEIRSQLEPIEGRVSQRFDEVMTTLDTLVANDEKREQENLIRDKKLNQIEQRVESAEHRLDVLEKKVA